MRNLWFRSKTYGWGWTPVTWQGWAVVAIYVAVLAGSAKLLIRSPHGSAGMIGFVATAFVATALLIFVCWKTGETPRWRWGK